MCYRGVDAFLFVIKFGQRFTHEDKETLEALTRIFGVGFMKHVIVVVTCGDRFQGDMEERETPDKSFHEWCRDQEGAFKKLYEDCEGRFVLFNNREKDEKKKLAQRQEIVQLAQDLQNRYGRYTSDSFKKAEYEREKMILQLKAPHLKEEFQKRHFCLSQVIEDLAVKPSNDEIVNVRNRLFDLRREIQRHDKGYKVLQELLEMTTKMAENLNDVVKLKALGQSLKEITLAKAVWDNVGLSCVIAGCCLCFVAPPVGISMVVGGTVVYGLGHLELTSEEKDNVQQQEQLKNKKKP